MILHHHQSFTLVMTIVTMKLNRQCIKVAFAFVSACEQGSTIHFQLNF
uniref:Uncharacterized protein n=1 Tax=Anguilla anguilla TaxID=7936 RepID=A0A0E9WZ64_ANGAN